MTATEPPAPPVVATSLPTLSPEAPPPEGAPLVDGDEFTYSSKVPPDHPGLRLGRTRPRTLRKGPALAAAAGLILASGIAVAVATRSTTDEPTKPEPQVTASNAIPIDDSVRSAPGNEAPLRSRPPKLAPPKLGPPLHGQDAVPGGPAGGEPSRPFASNTDPSSPSGQRHARHQAFLAELEKARGAPLLATVDDPAAADRQPPAPTLATGGRTPPQIPASPGDPSGAFGAPGAGGADQNMQQRKNDFLAHSGVNNATTLEQPIKQHRSPYELLAGAIIPTSLITGINSDLPGQILGQVRENVFDTVTGQYLLIPQGSRLLATYDSMVGFGQERVLVCWNRLIRPDGTSITLECMPGIDLSGYAGFADDVDHHWWRILAGVAIGSLISAGAQASQGSVAGVQPSLPQLWVGGASAGVNQATQQITSKNLQIQPTIHIRPGYSVNVLVTKDLVLPPFQGASP